MTNVEALKEVCHLIENGWTQEEYARNKDGGATTTCSPHATCFCLAGACMRVDQKNKFEINTEQIISRYIRSKYQIHTTVWNDKPERTKEEVLALLDEIISLEGLFGVYQQ